MGLKTTIRDVLETIVCLIVTLPLFIVLLVCAVILIMIKLGVCLYLKIVHPSGKVRLMQLTDAIWTFETEGSTSNSNGVYIIEGECDPEKIRQTTKAMTESELVGGKMSQKVTSVFGFPCWEKIDNDKMDMKDYVKVIMDDEERGYPVDEDELFNLMSTQDKPSWPIGDKAPWKMLVIPRFAYKNSNSSDDKLTKYYAVVYQIHHGIMDGISTGNILHSVMADPDKPFKLSVDPTKIPKPPLINLVYLHTLALISIPRMFIRSLYLKDTNSGTTKENTGPKSFTWSRPIYMDALKGIKNSTKTSVYSVMLSSIAGGFERFLDKTKNVTGLSNGSIQEKFHVMSTIAMLPYPDRKPQNRVSGALVPASICPNISPVERLKVNNHSLLKIGRYSSAVFALSNWYCNRMSGLLPIFLHKQMNLQLTLKMSLSNVPGPSDDVWIYGNKIIDMCIWLPIKYAIGLGVGVFSYKGVARVSFAADKAHYPNETDLKSLTDAFEEELAELGKITGNPNVFEMCSV